MSSLRERILGAPDLVLRRAVPVPEWDQDGEPCVVHVRMLTVRERDGWEAKMLEARESGDPFAWRDNFRAGLVVRCAVDHAGERIFADEDAEALGEKSWKAVHRIAAVAIELNGLGALEAENAEKN